MPANSSDPFGLRYQPGGSMYGQKSPFGAGTPQMDINPLTGAPNSMNTALTGAPNTSVPITNTQTNLSSNAPNYNVMAGAPGNRVTTAPTSSSYGDWNPMAGAPGNVTTKAAPLQNSTMPQADNGLGYISGQDQVVDAMAAQQRPQFSMYNPLKGLLKIGSY